MLAQNFMAAEVLGLNEMQHRALVLTLNALERGELKFVDINPYVGNSVKRGKFTGKFNMGIWNCGSVCCIAGAAELLGNLDLCELDVVANETENLHKLFYPLLTKVPRRKITVAQAAQALRSYLTCGEPRWDEAVASQS